MMLTINRGRLGKWQAKLFCSSAQLASNRLESYTYSGIVSSYMKEGRIQDAEKMFGVMPVKTVVEWSIMVHGYAKCGLHRKSFGSFKQMREFGLVPSSFTFVGVLVSAAGLRDLVLCMSIHGMILKSGWGSNLIVNTAMLDSYAKSGNVDDSYSIFMNMSDVNQVSWSAMIAGFLCNKRFVEGFIMFKHFQRCGHTPNVAMILTLTQGCLANESHRLCESIHNLVLKLGFLSNLSVNNAVLSMYSSLMNIGAATKLFGSMQCRDIISWTTMIGLLVRLECARDAVSLFLQLRKIGISYDWVLLMHLLLACGLLGALKMGRSVHAQLITNGFHWELPVTNSMITMYSRCGDLHSSRTIFQKAPLKSVVSFTSMILGYIENGRPEEALDLFIRARQEENYDDDTAILVSALTAAGEVAYLDTCQQLHCYTIRAGFQNYRSIQNTLISIYSKCGRVQSSRCIFEQMGSLRNVVSWNALISGYGVNGCGEAAVSLFNEMGNAGEDPDGATYLSVLSACSHSGLVRDGLIVFKEMVDENRVSPCKEHYGCVADLLARAGYVSDTSKLVEDLDSHIWKALINGCLLHGNINLAEVAAKRLFKKGLMEPGQVVLLSNLYASVGRFEDAEALRLSMDSEGLNKDPGFSSLIGNLYEAG